MYSNGEIKGNAYPISDVAGNEWKSFAMYTVEARAIPNMIDGLKPVQRFYLYSSILNSRRDFKKVSAVSGIISDYGYNHGESSAASAGQLMASTWNNNICLIEGRGSFGTRLVQEAGASRYVYTRLHDNFSKFIKDTDLSPVHDDPEHEPPAFYLPVIPIVLANGTKGIATGFATNILPRDPQNLIEACKEYLEKGSIKDPIRVKFPEFEGAVEYDDSNNRYEVLGIFKKKGKTVLIIEEVPYGFDRESYIQVLDKLEDTGEIVSYEDQCDKDGFKFEVKLKQNLSASWKDTKIIQKFKLSKFVSENLTVIGYDGKLREYKDARDLVKDFCDYRLGILQKRIDKKIEALEEENRWLKVKMQFILGVLDSRIQFKDMSKAEVSDRILDQTDAIDSDIDRLLRINLLSLTEEMVCELSQQQKETKKELQAWNETTPKDQFLSDIASI